MNFRKFIVTLLAAVMCIAFSATTVFADNADKVIDNADLLSDSEEQNLEKMLLDIVDEYGYDAAVLTVDSTDGKSMMAYADDYYDYNGYGKDGLMLLVNMDNRKWWITTSGKGISAFTDDGIQDIGNAVAEYLGDGDYYDGFVRFAELADKYIDKYEETGKPMGRQKNYVVIFLISLGIGLVFAAIICLVLKSQLKTAVRQVNAKAYVKAGSRNVTYARDIYLYKKVTREKIESDNGSSTHTSSSGNTHGGGGGSF